MNHSNFKEVLKKAQEDQRAIGHFNISNLEGLKAIAEVMQKFKVPLIIGTSEGERKFIGRRQVVKLIEAYSEELGLPIIVDADHTKTLEEIKLVVDAGYGYVHFDGSGLPIEENLKITKEVMEYAKSKDENILVEGELGYLRGGSDVHEEVEIKPEDLTKPEEAANFVKETGVDSLAIAIGNVHGIVKKGNPGLHLDRLAEIQKAVPDTFLVLHGGSGISDDDMRQAIKTGIVKVNVNTELRVAYTDGLKKAIEDNPDQTTPYKLLPGVVDAVKEAVQKKVKLFQFLD